MKTADEMFAELGFKRAHIPECIEIWTARIYELNQLSIVIEYSGYVEAREYNKACGLSKKEILACAQLIKEMEATNGND